ncbi:MAG: sulfotransferase family 2 domain-containing protein [Phycisphaerales bacterium]|nr:sulfotransferase family 2 domain-containing protein [Phycisphaerales bacterium]
MPPLYFLHIPKTAGTTLTAWLDQHYRANDILPKGYFGKNPLHVTREEFERKKEAVQHYKLIHGHYGNDVLRAFFPGARSITILREPTARVVSLYNDWRTKSDENREKAPELAKELIDIARNNDIEGFLRSGHELCRWQFIDGQARQLTASLYLDEPADPAAACAQLEQFSIVGTTKLLTPTTRLIARMMGWTPPSDMAPLNTTRGHDRFDELKPSTRELIHELTQNDQIVYKHAQKLLSASLTKLIDEGGHRAGAQAEHGAIMTTPIEIRVDDPIDGDGWHVLEGETQKWRWTGPGRASTIRLPKLPAAPHRLTLRIISVIADDILQGTHLLINGSPLEIRIAGIIDGQIHLHADIPAPLLDGAAPMLTILVPRTMAHSEIQPETGDHRQKGLAITSMLIGPIDPFET